MVTTVKPVTVEELWEMREEPYRLALIDGQLYQMPGAGLMHGDVAGEFVVRLRPWVKARGLGIVCVEVGFRLFPNRPTTLFPDVAFVKAARLPSHDLRERFVNLPPDLAVEIDSPTDYPKLLHEKLAAYAEAGTPLVWVAYPRTRSITVHPLGKEPIELGPDDIIDGGEVLPGFSIRVGDLFP